MVEEPVEASAAMADCWDAGTGILSLLSRVGHYLVTVALVKTSSATARIAQSAGQSQDKADTSFETSKKLSLGPKREDNYPTPL